MIAPDFGLDLEKVPIAWLLLGWTFSAAIQALPEPKRVSKLWYDWLYDFLHILGANVRLVGKRMGEGGEEKSGEGGGK